ncbi:MAG: hypothetical protein WAL75_13095 [Terracidiphilus sp.]
MATTQAAAMAVLAAIRNMPDRRVNAVRKRFQNARHEERNGVDPKIALFVDAFSLFNRRK